MEVQVEILIQVITGQYGTLNPGDVLRTNAAFAAHLVNDCGAAAYCQPVIPQPATAVAVLAEQLAVSTGTDVQTSAQDDPYAHLGTLVATVTPGAAIADDATGGGAVDTSLSTVASSNDPAAAGGKAPAGDDVQTSAQVSQVLADVRGIAPPPAEASHSGGQDGTIPAVPAPKSTRKKTAGAQAAATEE